jgi:hypothetical protein
MEAAVQNPKQGIVIVVAAVVGGFITSVLGGSAWWVMPPALFIGFLNLMLATKRQYLTLPLVLAMAGVSAAIAVVLKLT